MNEIMFPGASVNSLLHGITTFQMARTIVRVHSRLDRNNDFSESFDEIIVMDSLQIHVLDWVIDGLVAPMLFELDPDRFIRAVQVMKQFNVWFQKTEETLHYEQLKRFNCMLYLCLNGDIEM